MFAETIIPPWLVRQIPALVNSNHFQRNSFTWIRLQTLSFATITGGIADILWAPLVQRILATGHKGSHSSNPPATQCTRRYTCYPPTDNQEGNFLSRVGLLGSPWMSSEFRASKEGVVALASLLGETGRNQTHGAWTAFYLARRTDSRSNARIR